MKFTYSIHQQWRENGGRYCILTNEAQFDRFTCGSYQLDSEKVAKERKRLARQDANTPFLWGNFIKGKRYLIPSTSTSPIEIKRSQNSWFLIGGFYAITAAIGLVLYIYGSISLTYDIKMAGLMLAVITLGGAPFLWVVYKRRAVDGTPILTLDKVGIEVNGQKVVWEEYLGFTVENHGNGNEAYHVLHFHSVNRLENSLIDISMLPLSVEQLRMLIERFIR